MSPLSYVLNYYTIHTLTFIGAPQSMFTPPPVSGGPPFPPALPNNAHLPHLPPDSSDSAVDMQIASSPPLNSEV